MNRAPASRRSALLALGAASTLCLALLEVRAWRIHHLYLRFLIVNLVLAWVPIGLAIAVDRLADSGVGRAADLGFAASVLAWFLMFPNAPYLITDLVHVGPTQLVPMWFDVFLYVSFGCTGLLCGYFSLALVHEAIRRRFGVLAGWWLVAVSAVGAGFGIYLGRFQRWNSWDALRHPSLLARMVRDRLTDPTAHARTYVVTAFFAVFLLVGYGVLRAFGRFLGSLPSTPAV